MHSEVGLVEVSRKRRTRWFVIVAVGMVAAAVGYALAYALGCSTSCAVGRAPLALAALIGVTAAVAAASGMQVRR